MNVGDWLRSLGLGRYEAAFRENAIDDIVLPNLTAEDLKDLGVGIVGHRRKLLDAIAALRDDATGNSGVLPAADKPAKDSAERRHLTVLFCDLVGSTELSTRLDPEDMRDVLRDYQDACSRVITRYEGHIAKFMGDGVYAYFGYPRAHEDDAERAVHAAIDIVAAVRRLGNEKIGLAVRIGVATGPVVVGDLLGQGAAQEAAVTGQTPNLAGRLQSLAEANAIIISDATHRLTAGIFECRDLGKHALKGFAEPVPVWSVIRPRSVESRFDATRASGIAELIGRDEEIEILLRRWQRAKAGQGQTVLIAGEPGIGKSRLVRALLDAVAHEPHRRLFFQCSSYHTGSALYPVIEHLQRAARFDSADETAAKLSKLEALLALAGPYDQQTAALFASLLSIPTEGRYPALAFSPPQLKERTLNALIQQVEGLSKRQPILFVFEDVHWIDPTSMELLERTVTRLEDLRLLVLITYRPEFTAPWTGGAHVSLIALNRLSRQDRAVMAESVAGGTRLPKELLNEIVTRTDGVPLFVEELTKSMLESVELQSAVHRGTLREAMPRLAIPDTLQDALMARLDRLAPNKDKLQMAACIGREFSLELLAQVSRVPKDDLSAALDQFIEAELIFRRGDPPAAVYTFKHALVQDAAYSSLLRNRRVEIHGTIASVIESRFSDIVQTQPEIVAHHLTEAGLIERAVPMWVQAGRNAARKSANTEAIRHFNMALDLVRAMPEGHPRKRLELMIQINLGPVYMTAKGFGAPEAGAAYARARDLAHDLQDSSQLFTSIWGLWLFNLVQPREARSLSEELLTLGMRNADSGQILQACHASWTTNFFLGDFKYTSEQARRGRELYDPSQHSAHKFLYGGHDPGVCSQMFGAASAFVLGFPDQALTMMRDGLALAGTLDHPLSLLLAELWLAIIHLLRGEPDEVSPVLDRAIRIASDAGIPQGMWANFLTGWALTGIGQPGDGVSQALSDFDAVGTAGQEVLRPYYTGLLADMCRAAGRLDDAVRFVEKALTLATTRDSQWCFAELNRIKGELMLEAGGLGADAESCFETAIAIAREQSAKSWELRATASLARLRLSQGRRAEGRSLLAPVYGSFTEGFKSPDLKAAKALMEKLSNGNVA